MGLQIFFILLVILLNGIFASSEMALVSANRKKVIADTELKKRKANKAKKLLKFMEKPTRFLSTIQLGITIFGFINGAIAASTFAEPLTNGISTALNVDALIIYPIATVLITVILAFVQVVLGELVPKRIAMRYPEETGYLFIGFLSALAFLMTPFVVFLTWSANFIVKLFGINPHDIDDTLTEDELRLELNASELKGIIDKSENKMIQNIFEFDDTTVEEVMTHRTEVSAIDVNTNKHDTIDIIMNDKYTRFPVYEGSIDNIIGVLHVKDLIRFVDKSNDDVFVFKDLIRDPYFVPESKNTRQLFVEMQASKNHIAIVIDEYGGTAGIVTLEDLIEEIVGNIFDEYDDEEIEISSIKEDEYEVDGLTSIDDVEDIIHADLPVEEYDTLSGFILGQLGRFPEEDEAIVLIYNNYRFEVLEYNDKVIDKVKLTRVEASEDDNQTDEE